MTDEPIAFTKEGRPLFDNTASVAVIMAKLPEGLLMIRRNNNPGKGLIGLPGGFHMRGETWQQAGSREVWEETGYFFDWTKIVQYGPVVTDEFGHNLIYGTVEHLATGDVPSHWERSEHEVQEVIVSEKIPSAEHWAFPRHFAIASTFGLRFVKGMYPTINGIEIYEVANQLGGYIGPKTPDRLAEFLLRESNAAAALADEIVRLRRVIETQADDLYDLYEKTNWTEGTDMRRKLLDELDKNN